MRAFVRPRSLLPGLLLCAATAAAQQRELPPNTGIPPNYDYYTLNAGYAGDSVALGWAESRIEERLGRGLVAVRTADGGVYLGWRLLESDPAEVAFHVYRATGRGRAVRVSGEPVRRTTDFVDRSAPADRDHAWFVRAVVDGREQPPSARAALPAGAPARPYLAIHLRDDLDARSIHKVGVGDLDGDGEYDFVVKRPGGVVDPGRVRRSPDTFKVEGYRRDGTFLWRNDLGWSIELGTWYSPMVVYDLDGDGRAEVALKTGEGDPRDANGQVLTGPEYVSTWDGLTGREVARVPWIERGDPRDWGDAYGNRMNRNLMGIAYLDGKTPALLVARGTYGLQKMDAWLLRDRQMRRAWHWTNQTSGFRYQGQGQHTLKVADVDGDGADEVLNGATTIESDGRILWSTGMGHGDRMYVTDVDPARPGLEVVYIYEDPHPKNGFGLWDARTGELIFGIPDETADNQLGSALVADIDPAYPGMELWADRYLFSARGERIPGEVPPQTGLVWWDADPLREIAHRGTISKWKGDTLSTGIEGQVMLWADLVGDWREEIVTYAAGELRVYTTTIPASDRRPTLMQDPIYRLDVAHKSMGYDMPPMTSFYLGAAVQAAQPTAARATDPSLPTLFYIGDSTVRNGSGTGGNGEWGWGDLTRPYFDSTRVNVVNRALGGRSSRTFLTQGHWDRVRAELKRGDVVIMQFGHNDGGALNDTSRARGTIRGVGEETEEIDNLLTKRREVVHSYGWYLRKFIADARARGATPVVASLVPRNVWENGAVVRNRSDYAGWAREVARAEGVPFLDLNEIIAREYDRMGPERVRALFGRDHTHTNLEGAKLSARMVVAALRGLPDNPLAPYLTPEAAEIPPAPDPGR